MALALVLLLLEPHSSQAAEQLVDGIAAQVGGQVVLISEVLDMTSRMEAEMRTRGAGEADIARLRSEGLERVIEWRLIEQIVRQAELSADDGEIDRAIEAIAAENGLTADQLGDSVTSQGITLADYRGQLKREIERGKVLRMMVSSKIEIVEADLEALYAERYAKQPQGGEQLHLRQLLILFGGDTGRTRDEACEAVTAARERIVAGEPFPQVAGEHNAIAADRGGDVGWVHQDSLAGWMATITEDMKPGELSEVTAMPFGCNLLQLEERREYQFVTLEMARARLTEELFSTREAKQYHEWIEKLRENTYIKRHGQFANAAGFTPGDSNVPGEGASVP